MKLQATVKAKGAVWEGKAPDVVNDALTDVMYDAVMFLEAEVKERTPQGVFGAQGGLRSTIHGEVVEKGTTQVKGIVAHQSPYGDVIEKGREAGKAWPPPGALLRWIEEKFGVDESVAARLEFVIRRKIGQKGFEGAFMFEKAFDENWGRIQDMFDRAGFTLARRLEQ